MKFMVNDTHTRRRWSLFT